MTLSTTENKVSYAGDGATVVFAIPFLFLENAHIEATLRDGVGVETGWALNTQFALSGAGQAAGGTLTVSTSPDDHTPAAGETLVIRRVVPETQETDYPEGGAFPAAAHEGALDKLTMLVQQQSEEIARALRLPVSSPLSDIRMPEPGAGELVRWNAGGTALETAAVGDLSLDIAAELTAPAPGDRLVFDGANWKNAPSGVFNVRAYGATGDGATDDASAVQAAADALAASDGGILYFPAGTYLVSSSISVPSDCVVRGAGAGASTVRASSVSVTPFAVQGSVASALSLAADAAAEQADIVLSDASSLSAGDDILIVGNTSAGATRNVEINRIASIATNTLTMERDLYDTYAAANAAYVQKIAPAENVTFRDLTIQGAGAGGVEAVDIGYARHVVVDNCEILDAASIFADFSEHIVIRNCRLRNMADAVRVQYTKWAKVLDCHIDKSVSGVVVYDNSDGALVRGCTIKNMSGVPIQANFYSEDAVFDSNHIAHFEGGYGILTDNNSNRAKVTNNTVRYGGASAVGIQITDASYSVVQANHVAEISNFGIDFEGTSFSRCIANLVENIGSTNSHPGIVWDSSAFDMSRNICAGNVIRGTTGAGIHWNATGGSGASNICTGNIIEGITFRGIEMAGLDYTTVRNNSFEGSTGPNNFFVGDEQTMNTMVGDGHIQTPIMDLSGADTGNKVFFVPPTDVLFFRARVIVGEATSADDGVRVYVSTGSGGGSGAIVDFAAGSGSLLKNLALFDVVDFTIGETSDAIKQSGDIVAGDPMYWRNFGGKTGAGEIMIQLDYITLGGS